MSFRDLVGTANAVDTHTGDLGATIYAASSGTGDLGGKIYGVDNRTGDLGGTKNPQAGWGCDSPVGHKDEIITKE